MTVQKQGQTYVKTDPANPTAAPCEAAGLAWLAQAMPAGGAHVTPVIEASSGRLVTRAIDPHWCTPAAAYQFGRALAHTHAAGAEFYGQAPPGWSGPGWMGTSRLILRSEDDPHLNWGQFYAEDRVLPNLAPAVNNGSIPSTDAHLVETLCERLRDGVFDHYQPHLVTTAAARIHGDLWSGNVLWPRTSSLTWAPQGAGKAQPQAPEALPEVVGVLIDPAAHGGHAETDLANLSVFGQAHIELIYEGYNSESKLADGWRERIALHQLHMMILHAALFGGDGYGAETVRICAKYQ